MSQPTTESVIRPVRTLVEWAAEDEPGELVDGRLIEEEVPDSVHEMLVALLIRVFANWAFPLGGVVLGSEAKFAVGPDRGRKPDLTVYLPGRPLPPRRGPIRIPPDIAVEVVSPTPRDGRRDRVEKAEEYARFGVRYYWIVDPELRSLEVLALGPDRRYARALGAIAGRIEVPGCEGLTLDLDSLWTEIDRLPPEEA